MLLCRGCLYLTFISSVVIGPGWHGGAFNIEIIFKYTDLAYKAIFKMRAFINGPSCSDMKSRQCLPSSWSLKCLVIAWDNYMRDIPQNICVQAAIRLDAGSTPRRFGDKP